MLPDGVQRWCYAREQEDGWSRRAKSATTTQVDRFLDALCSQLAARQTWYAVRQADSLDDTVLLDTVQSEGGPSPTSGRGSSSTRSEASAQSVRQKFCSQVIPNSRLGTSGSPSGATEAS